MLANVNTQKLDFRLMELALLRVAEEVCFLKALERLADSRDMFL